MATSTASILAPPPHLQPASQPKTCSAESTELGIGNEEDSFPDMVILASGSSEPRSTSLSEDSDCSEAGDTAVAPSWSHKVQEYKEMVEDGDQTKLQTELDQVYDDCTAAVGCTEAFPVVFACSVEQVRAADESDVQCSLRIYRQEANIILSQPRVMESIRAFNHRDGVSHEGGEMCDSFSFDSQDSSREVLKPHEPLSEENSAGDEQKSGAMSGAEKEEDDPSSTPVRHSDFLAPILLLLAAAAGVALVAAVVHPFGANLSSGIIAIAVFLSLSKWHTPP